MLPWGSQYRNVVSREGHAWILADLARDPQVAAAAELASSSSSSALFEEEESPLSLRLHLPMPVAH